MNTSELYQEHILATYGRFPITLAEGKGVRVRDVEGREYLDFCMGIAVCSLGHCHPRVVDAICAQAAKLMHVSNLYYIDNQGLLAEEMNLGHIKLPGKIFFSNSGAEANDGLIKSARRYGHHKPQANGKPRFEVLTFQQSFHGRTLGAMAATGQAKIQQGFDPMLPGFRYLPFNDVSALENAVSDETVGFLVEPVQGEGGVNVASKEFLEALDALCKKHDLLLIFDEVQAGFGRCGEAMAWRVNAPDIEPDGISWAKGMGGGVPIGSFWLSDRVIDDQGTKFSSLMGAGSHGSTYGGNPLVCAAALETLREIREKDLASNAIVQEKRIRATIASWNLPVVTEVRGLGLLLGIGLNTDLIEVSEGETPALKVVKALMAKGLLTVPAGTDTFRLLPPLNVTESEIDEALTIIKDVLSEY
ncbi:MAG: acetylornithine/succinylornithine family transaminase [Akkermansiaceae bacterium]|jgi:acetylornithine/N-succinyldiaminopimelate aminotransferase|nr:acetylornithine/succinylornithine family transaminase [Akkermansiaceae bacterium]MDP4647575.1 acetylornithine/succinylornithine family transaminase [Akkermansiaceae bacterium]MDP4720734.1 acetylornithine/succinylornithine family transaminase [Akkermansiaceae bacterium]MDP4779137.1 acetylornithine/succinylornithine family transaminase [Akkermansiaceae bacterium]MDP4847238.1 acetylornithine/succinylornithine family transaminase [Akkermansiaceae bacterium]